MIVRTVVEAAQRWGDRSCLVSASGWALSYRDLDRVSGEVAAELRKRGLVEGDVVALVLPSMPEHMIAYAAAAKVGAITAGVNARLTTTERDAVLERCRPRIVIATAELAPGGDHVSVIEPARTTEDALAELRVRGGGVLPPPPDPDRPVAIVFTSGTTGVPKGALFCNRQLEFISHVDTGNAWGGGGASLSATSMAHLGPTTKLPGNLHRGGTTYLLGRWTAEAALAMTERHAMASVAGIPTQLALMLRHPNFDRTDLSSVHALVIGGGPATGSLIREARRRFDAPLATRYACTEAGIGLGTGFTDPLEDAEVSVGRPHDGVELTLRDPDDSERSMPDGDVGEVCLRSPAVMSGYWRDPEATAAAFTSDGFVRTGDLGVIDEQGRLRLVGRAKEMYVRGGYNVYPMEVEAVLADHPSVAAVAVIPRSDDVMGEVGVAVVVVATGRTTPTLDDLRSFAAERLGHHKLPEQMAVADELPLTPMEKVDRRALAERFA